VDLYALHVNCEAQSLSAAGAVGPD